MDIYEHEFKTSTVAQIVVLKMRAFRVSGVLGFLSQCDAPQKGYKL